MVFESQDEGDVESGLITNDNAAMNSEKEVDVENVENDEISKRNKHTWTEHSRWNSLDDVGDFLEAEGFVVFDDKELKCGHKFYLRCSRIPKDRKRCEWCSRRYIIFLPSDTKEIILQSNNMEHNHNELLKGKKRQMSPEMLEFINDLYDKETKKASSVLLHINAARENQKLFLDEPNPTNRQLVYSLDKYKRKETGKMIHLGDLADWCEGNSSYPTNVDGAFVLSHEIVATGDKQGFRFCITTPHLLEMLSKVDTICIDATYKLNWQGFPLIILGTVDRLKRFHPMVYACSSHEATEDYAFVFKSAKNGVASYFPQNSWAPKKLIADGADQIRNAFYQVFEDCAEIDIMCFAHVIRNLRKRPFASKKNKALIVDDVRKIQLAPNRNIFDMMTELFMEKWRCNEPNFVTYFKTQWLGAHRNWFEGASEYAPSTNNALESHNATIKRRVTFRRRLPLEEFLPTMLSMASEISKQFTDGLRDVATEPKITRELMMRSAEMVNNQFQSFKATAKGSGRLYYVLPAQKCIEENRTYKYYKALAGRKWSSFDEFIEYGYQIFWLVCFNNDHWETQSTCSCPFFFKQHICKHLVAIALQSKIIECPQSSNPLLIAPRRKRGRAKNATMSLMRD